MLQKASKKVRLLLPSGGAANGKQQPQQQQQQQQGQLSTSVLSEDSMDTPGQRAKLQQYVFSTSLKKSCLKNFFFQMTDMIKRAVQ